MQKGGSTVCSQSQTKIPALGQTPGLREGTPQGTRELWPAEKDTFRNIEDRLVLKSRGNSLGKLLGYEAKASSDFS